MAETEKPKEPDFNKYENDLTNFVVDTTRTHSQGIENIINSSWAEWNKKATAEPDKAGNLGDIIYNALEKYVATKVYGMEDAKPKEGNDEYKDQVKKLIKQTIGYDRSTAKKLFEGKTTVNAEELEPLIQTSKKAIKKSRYEIVSERLDNLTDNEFEDFRDYVLSLGKEAGVKKLTKETMPKLSEAKVQYMSLLQRFIEPIRNLKKSAEEYDPADVARSHSESG